MILLYVSGMAVGVLAGLLMKNTLYKGNPVPFVICLLYTSRQGPARQFWVNRSVKKAR